jgi:hypothetical protein
MVRGFYLVEVLRSEVIAKGFSLLLSEKGARRASGPSYSFYR